MTVRMTVAQAKALGLIGEPVQPTSPAPRRKQARTPDPVKCRCTKCDVILVGETACDTHLSETGHLRYESIT